MEDSHLYKREVYVGDFIKPLNYRTPAYNSVRNILQMYRLTGCCPIDGLWHKRLEDLKTRFRVYGLYSCACVLLAICTVVEVILDSGSRRNLEAKSNIFNSVIFAIQSTVNFGIMMSQGPHFVLLLRQCAMFQSRRPAPRNLVRKLKLLIVATVIYFVVFFTPLVSRRIYRTLVAHGVFEFLLRFSVTIGALYHLFWSTVAGSMLVIVAHLLKGYLEEVIKDIRAHEATMTRSRLEHQWAFLHKIRRDTRDIKAMVQTVNEVIQLGVLVTYGAAMACSCCCAFYIITTESSLELLMKVMAIGYVAHALLMIAFATHSSQALTDKARELKESMQTIGNQKLPRKVARSLLTFQLCFDVDGFSFNACGFFTVELSIIQAMVGVVVTYTLVLLQTKLSGVSVHSTECSRTT
ncbi:unnamed protein product [Ixodes persulcatus]